MKLCSKQFCTKRYNSTQKSFRVVHLFVCFLRWHVCCLISKRFDQLQVSPISDKKSNFNLLEIWANVSHDFSFSNWDSLNHLVSSSTQFLSASFYCINGQIPFYCSKHNLRVSKPRIFLAASVNCYSKTTRKPNYTLQTKANRAHGTMNKQRHLLRISKL